MGPETRGGLRAHSIPGIVFGLGIGGIVLCAAVTFESAIVRSCRPAETAGLGIGLIVAALSREIETPAASQVAVWPYESHRFSARPAANDTANDVGWSRDGRRALARGAGTAQHHCCMAVHLCAAARHA